MKQGDEMRYTVETEKQVPQRYKQTVEAPNLHEAARRANVDDGEIVVTVKPAAKRGRPRKAAAAAKVSANGKRKLSPATRRKLAENLAKARAAKAAKAAKNARR